MIVTSERKKELFKQFGGNDKNTGNSEAQIAMFSERINHLTDHLKIQPKDYATQQSLIKLVGKRRSLLNYLHKTDITRYRKIVADLGLRK
ncbi:MAG: 30S ribosomal protein S15 [Bacteroidetes bacterium]|jgi:small subunit ribosomal protein S15|nr:30S ribosomal protein S15 [Bacteroidia bacterium]MBS1924156.1 30S ribosomal protein S15 [Bacteroidota bacterium]MBP7715437.1 30S ribosomal protein S15 [Bacteroidia bacterium]MBP8667520.1 30S ribosomal protein S15 [Bacteroidia bacterium]MBX7239342.1 30S ribosomal protein S15 [Bacteroidia bacterium]